MQVPLSFVKVRSLHCGTLCKASSAVVWDAVTPRRCSLRQQFVTGASCVATLPRTPPTTPPLRREIEIQIENLCPSHSPLGIASN
ncbi:hypothetical protein J6590_002820 [Homalodisca vitripennis]|nr:hypothetical protein J6590_002820 [Homalodisca vitripennis]